MKTKNIIILIACVIGMVLLGAVSGIATSSAIDGWFLTVNKPSINPPNWVFGPVWTILYALMGYSLYRIIVSDSKQNKKAAYVLFALQAALNFLWSFLFFYFHQIGLALIEIIVLEAIILLMIMAFVKIDKLAAYANIPYFLWVAFATFLNYSFYIIN